MGEEAPRKKKKNKKRSWEASAPKFLVHSRGDDSGIKGKNKIAKRGGHPVNGQEKQLNLSKAMPHD